MTTNPGDYTGFTGAVTGGVTNPFGYPGQESSANSGLMIFTGRIGGYTPVAPTDLYGGEFHGGAGATTVTRDTEKEVDAQPSWFDMLNPVTAWQAATGGLPRVGQAGRMSTESYAGDRSYVGPQPPKTKANFESKSLGEFIASFANLPRDQMVALQKRLVQAGWLNASSMVPGAFDPATQNAVANVALNVAVQQQATGRPSVTFDSQINNDIISMKQAVASGLVPDPTPFTGARTRTDLQHTDPLTAEAITVKALADLLGRAPTPAEVSQYQSTLAGAESSHPVVTTTNFANGIETGSTSSGGITSEGAALLAQQQVQNNPEFGAFKAATTYIPALRQLMGALTPAGA